MHARMILRMLALPIISALLCGCNAMQSTFQQSKILKAPPSAMVNGETLRLESSLKRTVIEGEKFNLSGELNVIAADGSLPRELGVYHMALRPSRTGYYVLNFVNRKGTWRGIGRGLNDQHLSFTAESRREADRIRITFNWPRLGGLILENPDAFKAYDVSVTVTDALGKSHILTNPRVPTN